MTMKTRVKWVENVSFVGETGSGHALVIDGAPEGGGRDLGPRPMELFLTGATACTAYDVVTILRKARQPIADCVVEAHAERARNAAAGVHPDPLQVFGGRARTRPAAGHARRQAFARQVLLRDADARENRRGHATRS